MRLSRFERKILGAILLVAVAPMIAALVLNRSAIINAYQTGVNDRIAGQLDKGVDAYCSMLDQLRDDAERTADAIAYHRELTRVLSQGGDATGYLDRALERYPHVAAIRLSRGATQTLERRLEQRFGPDAHDPPLTIERELDEHRVEVVVMAPQQIFDDLQSAGDEATLYRRLQEGTALVSTTYLWVYMGMLGIIIIIALVLGVIFSRRVTKRVTALAVATRRVGKGDLSVTVPSGARDEVHELTEAFNAMVKDLRESRARIEYLQRIGAWQDFARRLAHEIKNPLTPIQLAAQEMHRTYKGDDDKYLGKLEEARAIIEEEIATLRRLVTEFSSFAKLPEADLSDSDLRDFMSEFAKALPAILEDVFGDGEPARVELDVQKSEMAVRIDSMMLRRCLDNLVRNALQALRGREDGKVRVIARRIAEEVVLRVEDNGPGVPETQRDRVFDPYFTTKSDGTGLGLAIVKKVVLEHQGKIDYERSSLGGAAFVIRLPHHVEGEE